MAITQRTFPTFSLTNKVSVTVRRKGKGDWVDGEWITSPDTLVTIEANVQPVQFKEIMMMSESERTKEWIKLYSVDELRAGMEGPGGWEADIVVWEGLTYRVMKSRKYVMGVLDHYHAMAAREPVSAKD